jgi:hypothetical protein
VRLGLVHLGAVETYLTGFQVEIGYLETGDFPHGQSMVKQRTHHERITAALRRIGLFFQLTHLLFVDADMLRFL